MHMHRIAEIAYDSFGAQTACFVFVRIAALDMQQLLILDSHTAPANPVFPVAGMNVIEIGQCGLACYRISDRRSWSEKWGQHRISCLIAGVI